MGNAAEALAVFAVTGALCFAVAPLRADADSERGGPAASQPSLSLEHEMGAINRAYKIVRSQIKDPSKNAATLAAVLEMEQHTLAAKSIVPRSATTMPTADANKDKLADYQSTMLNVLRQELDLEERLRANDNDKASESVDALHSLEDEGHAEFRPKRKREH